MKKKINELKVINCLVVLGWWVFNYNIEEK